jgi:hypothetical protein
MILNYHRLIIKKKKRFYLDNVSDITAEKKRWGIHNVTTLELVKRFNAHPVDGMTWPDIRRVIPGATAAQLREKGMRGWAYSWPITKSHMAWQIFVIKRYIKHNKPVMVTSRKGARFHGIKRKYLPSAHAMPVIGYQQQYYDGDCYKKWRGKEIGWLLVDTTWNSRAYLRFDNRGNYGHHMGVTYVNVR